MQWSDSPQFFNEVRQLNIELPEQFEIVAILIPTGKRSTLGVSTTDVQARSCKEQSITFGSKANICSMCIHLGMRAVRLYTYLEAAKVFLLSIEQRVCARLGTSAMCAHACMVC